MKITKEQLKQIIKEELEAILAEDETIEENYADDHYDRVEKECREETQKLYQSGQLTAEEAGRHMNDCMLSKRRGGA